MKLSIIAKANTALQAIFVTKDSQITAKDKAIFELQGFGFKRGEIILIQENPKLYVTLDDLSIDSIRESGAFLIRYLKKTNIKNIQIKGFGDSEKNYALMIGLLLGGYDFNTYKSKQNKEALKNIYIVESKPYEKELKLAKTIADSVNFVREIVNTPPQDCPPLKLASIAKNMANEYGLSCHIGDVKFLKKEKMNALLSVARASVNEPRLIELCYKPKKPKARVVLVGKGLTYDTGGLSLKPADYMTTMKADKSGGCAVLGIMKAIAMLKPNVEVYGIVGAVENAIGGDAYRPDDILSTRAGISVEVKNTDAEGRLVLADCLSYAQDLKPDYIIDLATLTGACVVALGEFSSGIMGYNEELKKKFENIALKSGELVATLPFNRHLEKLLESKNADISNVSSSRYGGAITAGLFLGRFIQEKYKDSWLHLDIAGPAFVEKEWDINPYGASGIGVRSVVDFILGMQ